MSTLRRGSFEGEWKIPCLGRGEQTPVHTMDMVIEPKLGSDVLQRKIAFAF